MSKKICHECGCTTYKLRPHPQDPECKAMICEDCEYTMMAYFDSLDDEPIKEYKDRRGV